MRLRLLDEGSSVTCRRCVPGLPVPRRGQPAFRCRLATFRIADATGGATGGKRRRSARAAGSSALTRPAPAHGRASPRNVRWRRAPAGMRGARRSAPPVRNRCSAAPRQALDLQGQIGMLGGQAFQQRGGARISGGIQGCPAGKPKPGRRSRTRVGIGMRHRIDQRFQAHRRPAVQRPRQVAKPDRMPADRLAPSRSSRAWRRSRH